MLTLLGTAASPFVRKVRVALIEKDIPFEYAEESPWIEDPLVNQYNPLGKVPVLLDDNGDAWFESDLIIEMIDQMQSGEHGVRRLDTHLHEEQFALRKLTALANGLTDAGLLVFLENKRDPKHISASWITRQQAKIERGIAYFENVLQSLRNNENPIDHPEYYLYQDGFSHADIALVCFLEWHNFRLGDAWQQQHPALAAYCKVLGERPSFRETRPPASLQ